jgi:hypothetical protein
MTIQDQYIDSFRQTQETWAGVVKYFTKDLQRSFDQPHNPFVPVDPSEAIDQFFDFWTKSLEVQRDVLKQIVATSVSAGEKVREQVESANTALREQVESTGAAVREQADSANAAFRKHVSSTADAIRTDAAKTYEDLTKADLQDELNRRELPRTGNVEELRSRLVADDLNA